MHENFLAAGRRVKVLIVDDTKTIRAMIRALLENDGRIEIVGEAGDPFEARDMIKALSPDVLTLDVEMPRMNGLVFLEKLMRLRPMPVVMVSTRTVEQSDEAVQALALGAIDCIDLRRLRLRDPRLPDLGETLVTAAQAQLSKLPGIPTVRGPEVEHGYKWNGKFVFIGSSTGGVDALLKVLGGYPANCPPTVLVQHMPKHFLASFAERLNANSKAHVRLAEDGDLLNQGQVLLAPGGGQHVELSRAEPPRLRLREDRGEELYIPSVAVLFRSLIGVADRAIAVMLTGMGRDGAEEMLRMKQAGALTIAQSSRSCVVDGMPRAAREIGAAAEVVDLESVADRICALSQQDIPQVTA